MTRYELYHLVWREVRMARRDSCGGPYSEGRVEAAVEAHRFVRHWAGKCRDLEFSLALKIQGMARDPMTVREQGRLDSWRVIYKVVADHMSAPRSTRPHGAPYPDWRF